MADASQTTLPDFLKWDGHGAVEREYPSPRGIAWFPNHDVIDLHGHFTADELRQLADMMDGEEATSGPSWIDGLADGFAAWLAAQPAEVRAQERRLWDAVAEGLMAWLADQPVEVTTLDWQARIDRFLKGNAHD